MPCKVIAAKGGGYNIVDPGGKVVGHSSTLPKAQASCRIRNEKSGYGDTGKDKNKSEEDQEGTK